MNQKRPNPKAAATLPNAGPAVDSDALATLGQAFLRGNADILARDVGKTDGQGGPSRAPLRRFSTWEVTRSMIPVATPHFRRVLLAHPDLPQGITETDGGTRWFTLDEVLRIRAFLAVEGARAKAYLPWRPKSLPAKIVTVANATSGTGKTCMVAHLAMAAALDGYRVLVIDLDAQGALTRLFGGTVTDEWDTAFPLVARHHARHMQDENRSRAARGEPPHPLDDTLAKALAQTAGGSSSGLQTAGGQTADDVIRGTHWPNIDLIGAGLTLLRAEMQIPLWRMAGRGWRFWDALLPSRKPGREGGTGQEGAGRGESESGGVLDRYDIILVDTPPALGHLSVAGLAAADIVLVPMGASRTEFENTGRFIGMLHATFAAIEDSENMAARALGGTAMRFRWDALRCVITRYDPGDEQGGQADLAALMQVSLGPALSPQRQDFSPLLRPGAALYEADPRDFARDDYLRSRDSFDASYAAFKRLLHGVWRQDERAAREGTAQGNTA